MMVALVVLPLTVRLYHTSFVQLGWRLKGPRAPGPRPAHTRTHTRMHTMVWLETLTANDDIALGLPALMTVSERQ